VLEAVFVLLEFSSPSRRIFIGSHSLPPSLVRRIGPSKAPKITKKEKREEHNQALMKPRRIIYTYHERFVQGLGSARSSFPLTRYHHEAVKPVLEIPREKEEENSKTK
jgi:hypothetical protein